MRKFVTVYMLIMGTIIGIIIQKTWHPLGATVQFVPTIYTPATTKTLDWTVDDKGRIIEIISTQTYRIDTTVVELFSTCVELLSTWYMSPYIRKTLGNCYDKDRYYLEAFANPLIIDTIYPCGDSI